MNTEAREILIRGPLMHNSNNPIWTTRMEIGYNEDVPFEDSIHIRALMREASDSPVYVRNAPGNPTEPIDYSRSLLYRASVNFSSSDNCDGFGFLDKQTSPLEVIPNTSYDVLLKTSNVNYTDDLKYTNRDEILIPEMDIVEGFIEFEISSLIFTTREELDYQDKGTHQEVFGGLKLKSKIIRLTPLGIEFIIVLPVLLSTRVEFYEARVLLVDNVDHLSLKLIEFQNNNGKPDVIAELQKLFKSTSEKLIYLSLDNTADVPAISWPLIHRRIGRLYFGRDVDHSGDWKDDSWTLRFAANSIKARIINDKNGQKSAADIISPKVSANFKAIVGEAWPDFSLTTLAGDSENSSKSIVVTEIKDITTQFENGTEISVYADAVGLTTRLKDLYRDVNGFKGDEETLYAFTPLDRGWLQLPVRKSLEPEVTSSSENDVQDVIIGFLTIPLTTDASKRTVNVTAVESLSATIKYKLVHGLYDISKTELNLYNSKGRIDRMLYLANTAPSSEEILPKLVAGPQALRSFPLLFDSSGDNKSQNSADNNWNIRISLENADAPKLTFDSLSTDEKVYPIIWESFTRLPLVSSMPMTRTSAGSAEPLYSRGLIPRSLKHDTEISLTYKNEGIPSEYSPTEEDTGHLVWDWPEFVKPKLDEARDSEVKSNADKSYITMIPVTIPGIQMAPISGINILTNYCFSLNHELPLLFELYANAALPDNKEKDPKLNGSDDDESDSAANTALIKEPAPTALHPHKLIEFWKQSANKISLARVRNSYATNYVENNVLTEIKNIYGDYPWLVTFSLEETDKNNVGSYKFSFSDAVIKYSGSTALAGITQRFNIVDDQLALTGDENPSINVIGNSPDVRIIKNDDESDQLVDNRDFSLSSRKTNNTRAFKTKANKEGVLYTEAFKRDSGEVSIYLRDIPLEDKGNDVYEFNADLEKGEDLLSDDNYSLSSYEWRLFSKEGHYCIELGEFTFYPKKIVVLKRESGTISDFKIEGSLNLKDLDNDTNDTEADLQEDPNDQFSNIVTISLDVQTGVVTLDDNTEFEFRKSFQVTLDDGKLKNYIPVNYSCKVEASFMPSNEKLEMMLLNQKVTLPIGIGNNIEIGTKNVFIEFAPCEFNKKSLTVILIYDLIVKNEHDAELFKLSSDRKVVWLGGEIMNDPEQEIRMNHTSGFITVEWSVSKKDIKKSFINKLCDSTSLKLSSKGLIHFHLSQDKRFHGLLELESDTDYGAFEFSHRIYIRLEDDKKAQSTLSKLDSNFRVTSDPIEKQSWIRWPHSSRDQESYIHKVSFRFHNHLIPIDEILGKEGNLAQPWQLMAKVKHSIEDDENSLRKWVSINYISMLDPSHIGGTDNSETYTFYPRYKQALDINPNPIYKAGIALEEISNIGEITSYLKGNVSGFVFIGGGSTMVYNKDVKQEAYWLSLPWTIGTDQDTEIEFSQSEFHNSTDIKIHSFDANTRNPIKINEITAEIISINETDEFKLLQSLEPSLVDDKEYRAARERWVDFTHIEQSITDIEPTEIQATTHPFFVHSIHALSFLIDAKSLEVPDSPADLEFINFLPCISIEKRDDDEKQILNLAIVKTAQEEKKEIEPKIDKKTSLVHIIGESQSDTHFKFSKFITRNAERLNIESEADLLTMMEGLYSEFDSISSIVLSRFTPSSPVENRIKCFIMDDLIADFVKLKPFKVKEVSYTSHTLGWPFHPTSVHSKTKKLTIDQISQEIGSGDVIQTTRLSGREHFRFYPAIASSKANGLALSFGRKVLFERPSYPELGVYSNRIPSHLITAPPRVRLATEQAIQQSLEELSSGSGSWFALLPPIVKRTTLGERPGALFGITDQVVSRKYLDKKNHPITLDKDFTRFGVVGDSSGAVAQQLRAPRAKKYPMDLDSFHLRRSTYFGSDITENSLKNEGLFKVVKGRASFFRLYESSKITELVPDNGELHNVLEDKLNSVGPLSITIQLSNDDEAAPNWKGAIDSNWNGEISLEMSSEGIDSEKELQCKRCYLELGNSMIDMTTDGGKIKFDRFKVKINSFKEIQKVEYELSHLRMDTRCKLHFILDLSAGEYSDTRHLFIDIPVEASTGYFHNIETSTLMFGDPSYDRKLGSPASQCKFEIDTGTTILFATDRKQYDPSSVINLAIGKFDSQKVEISKFKDSVNISIRIELIRDVENLEKGEAPSIDLFVDCDWIEGDDAKSYFITAEESGKIQTLDLKKLNLSEELHKNSIPVRLYGKDKLRLIIGEIKGESTNSSSILLEIVSTPIIAPPTAVYSYINYIDRDEKSSSEVVLHASSPMPTNIEFPNLLKDLATGYVRRSGLFIWSFPIKAKSEKYYLVKMDRSGGAQLPDNITDFKQHKEKNMSKYKIIVTRSDEDICEGNLEFFVDGKLDKETKCWELATNLIPKKTYIECSTTIMDKKEYKSVFLPNKQTGKIGIFIHQGSKPEHSDGCIVCAKNVVEHIYDTVPKNNQNIIVEVK